MGLIKAALSSTFGVLSDQFKEYFYCESLSADVLVVKGQKRGGTGNDNIISNGSIINVADGQCMIIVESGKVVDICAEPGEYTYDTSLEPSLFYGGTFSENISKVFDEMGKRFTFHGEAAHDQRIYYFNTKEITDNKFGTPSPIPFRVVDQRAGIDIDINLRLFGVYSYRITNPLLFYTNICSNITHSFTRSEIENQLRSELLSVLQPAFANISAKGIRYSEVPGHTTELTEILKTLLTDKWRDFRGIEIEEVAISSIKASEEDEAMLKEMQRAAAYTNPELALAYKISQEGKAVVDAANNANGAMNGFMGVNMMNNMSNNSTVETLYKLNQEKNTNNNTDTWTCECGATNTGKFCSNCGNPKPLPTNTWKCECGTLNTGKFCSECGKAKPSNTCPNCNHELEGNPKFCPNCGKALS